MPCESTLKQKLIQLTLLPKNIQDLFDDGFNVSEQEIVEQEQGPEWLSWLRTYMESNTAIRFFNIDKDFNGNLVLPTATHYLFVRLIN